jgi:UDP-N-acetylglucosamine 2-epimerase (non-hydrolysing)
MSQVFFDDLEMPKPDIYLDVGPGTQAQQTGKVMIAFEECCLTQRPLLVVVVGDVNSTVACAMVAAKLQVPCVHIEAGLRSFDRTMPEEINRIITDHIVDYLFTPSLDADGNLKAEGIPKERIYFVGNIMADSLLKSLEKLDDSDVLTQCSITKGEYAVLTMHRPSNVDDRIAFMGILDALEQIGKRIKTVFPVHPRTEKQAERFGFLQRLRSMPNIMLTDPLGYLDFLALVKDSKLVMTDSGGLQEETTILGIPCITLRKNTERRVTVDEGTNTLVGNDREAIVSAAEEVLAGNVKEGRVPELWDGKTAIRVADIIEKGLSS